MAAAFVVLVSLLLAGPCAGARVADCGGNPNLLPFIPGNEQVVSQCPNGVLTTVTGVTPAILVAHVYGDAKTRGTAYGTLLKPYIKPVLQQFWVWIDQNVAQFLHVIPKPLLALIEKYGFPFVLDLQYDLMKGYMSTAFIDEVRAVAAAAGIPFKEMMQLQMVPELLKAHCTMVGAWGQATPDGNLVQLRALDWAMNSPLQQWPLVAVYHANATSAFATLSWPGFMGALTGMSSSPVGICEKVWLSYDGSSTRMGIPFTLLLRDILEFDSTTAAAVHRIQTAKRTCSIFVGVGSPVDDFNIIQYSYENATVYTDNNFEISNPQHPQLHGVVYVDKHVQPSHSPCLGALLQDLYHGISAEALFRNVTSQHQTGDTHLAVYDYANMLMYVSNAGPWVNNTAQPAYDRAPVVFDMRQLFARKPSQSQ